ncbi:MAG: hypothetical protein MUF07_05010 [Steroidobacteraceae bacterium]|jgi:hypothetical protein|nr:hypothetical protein [Steroidobacteraceae bacterium]
MSKKIVMTAVALLSVSAAFATVAGAGTPVLDQRQQNQAQRIGQGVRSGELTRPETRRLVRGQRELRRDERAARADGVVTARERAGLQREANQQSRRIHRQKNDAQDRR